MYIYTYFEQDNMKANASKIQLLYLNRKNDFTHSTIMIGNTQIQASSGTDILGVEIDKQLNFKGHIDEICCQTGKQINALKIIKHHFKKGLKNDHIYNSYINCNFNLAQLSGYLQINQL